MTSRAKGVLNSLSSLGEDFSNPTDSIKPVLDKLSAIKFKSEQDRKNYIARIEERFGKDVADLVDQYAGHSVSSYPTALTPALQMLMTNINGVIRGNPG